MAYCYSKANSLNSKPLLVVAALLCLLLSPHSLAFDSIDSRYNTHYTGDDETILIEDASELKFSYSSAMKTFATQLLKFDLEALLSGGKNCRDAVIRNFSELSDRTNYRFNVKHDRVELKLSLNF